MKNLVFTLVFLVVCVTGVSQVFMPQAIPCLHINEYQELNEDVITHECLIIDGVNIPIDFPANEIELKSGGSIEVFPLTTFEPDASRIELLIEEPEFDVAWFEPAIVGEVPKFEKLEIGLTLPQDVQLLVDQFLEDSDIIPNLNPFNPEDIDIYAEFSRRLSPGVWTESKRINAFYFEEYERDVSGNTEDWHWDEVDSDYCFRVRYAPKEAGFVRCVIHCVIDGLEVQKSKFENAGFQPKCL